jgi:hypothetical protein
MRDTGQLYQAARVRVAELLVPPPPQAVVDITTHEHDLRGALGEPGARDSDELAWSFARVAGLISGRSDGCLRIEADGASDGSPDAAAVVRSDRFELFRALMGRRSAAQVLALDGRAAGRRRLCRVRARHRRPARVTDAP